MADVNACGESNAGKIAACGGEVGAAKAATSSAGYKAVMRAAGGKSSAPSEAAGKVSEKTKDSGR